MARRARRQVQVPMPAYREIERLAGDLEAMTGEKVTISSVIERAVRCLADAHAGNRWLSPPEQIEPLKRRVRECAIANVIALRGQAPELGIGKVAYDAERDCLLVDIEGRDDPVGCYVDSPRQWQPPTLPH